MPIGAWVMREACTQAVGLFDDGAMVVRVNVSARQLTEPSLIATVAAAAVAELVAERARARRGRRGSRGLTRAGNDEGAPRGAFGEAWMPRAARRQVDAVAAGVGGGGAVVEV